MIHLTNGISVISVYNSNTQFITVNSIKLFTNILKVLDPNYQEFRFRADDWRHKTKSSHVFDWRTLDRQT